jgi:hypothetical protein
VTVLTSDRKTRFDGAATASDEVVRMTVTGVDVKGQMFRRPATILMLDGRDCIFRLECAPESDGSVLLEFDYRQAEPKRQVLHARVKSIEAEAASSYHKVVVELEVAQTTKIALRSVEPQPETKKSTVPPATAGPTPSAQKDAPVTSPRDLSSTSPSNGISHAVPGSNQNGGAPVKNESREPLPRAQAENPFAVRDAVKSAVASELKQEINLLKSWISGELEKSLPGMVSSNMQKMVREAVEKQPPANNEASIQAINANVTRQIDDRIAELRIALEGSAKKLIEEQTSVSRTSGENVEEDLSSRVAAIMQSLEESTAAMSRKLATEQTEISQAAKDDFERELSSRATAIMRSLEESTAEMAKKLFDEQTEFSRTAGDTVARELNLRAATIMRSLEESTAEMSKKLLDEQAELSRTVGDKVERELSSRAALIVRSLEESSAEMGTKLLQEQAELSRTAGNNFEQELSSRAATIVRTFEESTDEMASRINASRAAAEAILTRSQTLQQEINDGMLPVQQVLQQLNDANRTSIEKLQSQATSELNRYALQFENVVNKISGERAIEFSMELEKQMGPNQQRADELLEKLGAVFQLLQSTARVQQERLTEHSRATAANFEKEIRAVLLRLAGVA